MFLPQSIAGIRRCIDEFKFLLTILISAKDKEACPLFKGTK